MLDVAVMIAVLGGATVLFKMMTSRGNERDDEIWATAARRVGGRAEIGPHRVVGATPRCVRLAVDGVPMVVDTGQYSNLNTRAYYTRVLVGPLPVAESVTLECGPRDIVRLLARKLGIDALPTGDDAFDDAVRVSGAPTALILAYLDGPMRRHLAQSPVGFELERGFIVVKREGVPSSPEPIVEMTRFAEGLVERWLALARGPARLAEGLGLTVERAVELGSVGAPSREGASSGLARVAFGVVRSRAVTLSLRIDDDHVLTIVSFDAPSVETWALERDATDAFTTSHDAPEAIRTFAEGAPSSLVAFRAIEGRLELAFEGLTPDRDEVATTLNGAIDAMTPLAPYR
jgi:hypothetical protein